VLIVALVNWLRRSNDNDDDNDKQGSQGSRDALDILDQRLARGEIDLDTYRKLKQEVRRR
jgi:putative membrane protein